ncbi:NADH-quinone oxidoreductase subunit M [Dysgonomonas sp. PH5-45]|uniref:complex I subunit 4 family protein n=1 Tax=unclassified Dysgonomonas TaxID=2630389 RepID=UPI0024738214|nr:MULTISPECIES: NADH-quinone oxidoreductase subunit M [unclassified Dysgonomonas]MDH6355743.1 NADH-quinone oxidoreductase subunit M [Dysgonomonas sp. PH5-45]MDH6388640.1 NADH-quinone oxidoreductase subunit M [Dysgonomonas sp. PH5-37]
MNILSLFVLVPVLMLLAFIPCRNIKQVRTVGVIGAVIELAMAVVLLFMFFAAREADPISEMLFVYDAVWFESMNIHYSIGVDGISVLMILLTAVIIVTGTFASWNIDPLPRDFFMWLTLLSVGVYGFFISVDMFTMFFFYEIALIPMYLLIGLWGTGKKEYSAMKLTLMLMGGSAFLFVGILGIYYYSGLNSFNMLEVAANGAIPIEMQRWIFPLTFLGFGVLGALFPFHTWSPDGHASAPTAVSMLHAGVLMKLGGYGCFRIAMRLMPEAADELGWIFLILTGISVVYGAFGAIAQTDLKYINAYSSVSHCGLVLFAILMWNQTAMTGAVMQMLSHGLMTALFFALIGMIYGRTHTRDIRELGGLMKIMPFLAVCYVLAGLASLGLPGLSGFVAEMTIFVGSFEHTDMFHRVFTIIACSSIVITAVYILKVVGKILYGPVVNDHHLELTDAVWYERVATVGLILCVAGMGMFPGWISSLISSSIHF